MRPTDAMIESTRGVHLRVRRWHGDASPPFVLVHGLASNARLWDGVARRLAAAGHAVYAVDLRAHGESDTPSWGYDTATAAADIAAVHTRLGIGPAVIAGQSWGANVVVRLVAEHPALAVGLALVDGGWIDLPAQFASWDEAEAALRPEDVDGLPAQTLRASIRQGHPDWPEEAVEATVASLKIDSHGQVRRRLPIADHMSIVRSMWDEPPSRDLSAITTDVVLMPAIPLEPEPAAARRAVVERAARALRRVSTREFVGADHDLHAQHPDAVAAELLALAKGR